MEKRIWRWIITIAVIIGVFFLIKTVPFFADAFKAGDDHKDIEIETVANMTVILPDSDDKYVQECYEQAEEEGSRALVENGIGVDIVACNKFSDQVDQINKAINKGEDCIIIYPIKDKRVSEAIEKAKEAEIPVVIYETNPDNLKINAQFLWNFDKFNKDTVRLFNEFYGKMALDENDKGGEYITSNKASDSMSNNLSKAEEEKSTHGIERSNAKMNIVTFHEKNDKKYKGMYKAFKKGLKKEIEIVSEFESSSRVKAMNEFEKWLENTNPEIVSKVRAVYTQDDETALGVLDAIQNYTGDIRLKIQLISSIGATKEGVENIDSAYEDLGVKQVTYNYTPVNIIYAMRHGIQIITGSIERNYMGYSKMFNIEAISIDNVKKFMDSNGYVTRYSIDQEE